MKKAGKVEQLEIVNNQNVITLMKKELNFKKKLTSFAFRPRDYYSDIFSFYYFRIIYVRNDEKIYFPMDSNIGNLCLPEYDKITNSYFCFSKLENNYNELALHFSVSSSNQNEYFLINSTKVYQNGNVINESNIFIYLKDDNSNDIDYYLFQFEFKTEEIRTIMSSFNDKIKNIFPQIYSPQMFHLHNFNKTCNFKVKNNYTLSYKYIFGDTGYMYLSFLGNIQRFHSNKNFKGRPFAFPIDSETKEILFSIINKRIIFYFQLFYNRKNKAVEELQSGEIISQIMAGSYFPLYYYFKIKNEEYANVDVNLRLSSYNESVLQNSFKINGYLLDEDSINRKIDGQYINLKDPIIGYYSDKFKIGFLHLNMEINNNKYFLIEIINDDKTYIASYMLIDLITREYNIEYYFMPINQYLIETFEGKNIREKNRYQMNVNQKDVTDVLLEFSPEYNDIELNFINLDYNFEYNQVTGFKKYRIRKTNENIINFEIINRNKKTSNYMIRYFFTTEVYEQNYFLNKYKEKKYIYTNNDKFTLSLTFNSIKILANNTDVDRADIYFYINGLLYKKNENCDELLNTTSILKEQIPLFENKTNHTYNLKNPEDFTLIFADIPRQNKDIYELQLLINVIIKDNILNEEFLIFNFEVDLNDIEISEEEEEKKFQEWIIVLIVFGVLFLALISFFLFKYKRLKSSKTNLENEMKTFAFSNNIQKNILFKDKEYSKKVTDYETTFI